MNTRSRTEKLASPVTFDAMVSWDSVLENGNICCRELSRRMREGPASPHRHKECLHVPLTVPPCPFVFGKQTLVAKNFISTTWGVNLYYL